MSKLIIALLFILFVLMVVLLFLIVVLGAALLIFARGDKKDREEVFLSLRNREGFARKYCKGYGLLREN